MRLTKIKLAGFKSFVDPTIFHVPSNLVGVVGPNGCGKSNIIDAVRWVMGESSARNLRGESMTDVIFNGSASRKPVGQATIELVFDNSEGRAGGPWSQYNEIAVKRVVTRDGESLYFLNGTRCRRRDITDIFLGTGLGPRSYAIIEQGTISRIIEARPEELRVFLEEAAGITKYKERRRETETRIQHTRDNLDRLNDVREELTRQLNHLQRQARAAEQYQNHRAEERRLKAELLGLRWRALSADGAARERELRERETALEAVVAEQRRQEAELESGRDRQVEAQAGLQQAQERFYAIGAEISRLEQTLEHQRQLRQRQQEELRQSERDLSQVLTQIQQDQDQLGGLESALAKTEPDLRQARNLETEADAALRQAEQHMHDWQGAWDAFNRRAAEPQRVAEVERARIEHLEGQAPQHQRRLERLRLEQTNLAAADLKAEVEDLQQAEQEAEAALMLRQEELTRVDDRIGELRASQAQLTAMVSAIQERLREERGRLSSLETLQEAALGRRQGALKQWLAGQRLESNPCLAENLVVETGWEQAAETVLGRHLEALCVHNLDELAAALAELEQGHLTLFETTAREGDAAEPGQLLTKVQAPWPLGGLLGGVQVAANLDEALARRTALGARESLVTADGFWLGRDWLRVVRGGEDQQSGVLAREREIQAVRLALARGEDELERASRELERCRLELNDLEAARGAAQDEVNRGHREQAQLQARANAAHARLEQLLQRQRALEEEGAELDRQMEQDREAVEEARQRIEEALLELERLGVERETLLARRDSLRAEVETHRAHAAGVRQEAQRHALATESLRTRLHSGRQALERLEAQREQFTARRQQLAAELTAAPTSTERDQLDRLLHARIGVEAALTEARHAVEVQEAELRGLEQRRASQERQAQELRQVLETQRLALSEIQIRRQTLLDQLRELSMELEPVLAELPADATEQAWQERLDKVATRIQRLGPVNLAAIDEFAQLAERKRYLDAQNDDLVEALTTLENAMRKIDRETRGRFKNTFEQVNAGLQTLFPRLFGGGQAYLELAGEDMLDAGITIMARPPGKRIGTIHLLSGGEKALAAAALVFAIFQLNPAPFCLLDEVDAPLDEANVARFGNLVQEMAEKVQFIFITHNKATMEIARHLAGVTMQEPGVSRLVAVDVDEAVRLAAV